MANYDFAHFECKSCGRQFESPRGTIECIYCFSSSLIRKNNQKTKIATVPAIACALGICVLLVAVVWFFQSNEEASSGVEIHDSSEKTEATIKWSYFVDCEVNNNCEIFYTIITNEEGADLKSNSFRLSHNQGDTLIDDVGVKMKFRHSRATFKSVIFERQDPEKSGWILIPSNQSLVQSNLIALCGPEPIVLNETQKRQKIQDVQSVVLNWINGNDDPWSRSDAMKSLMEVQGDNILLPNGMKVNNRTWMAMLRGCCLNDVRNVQVTLDNSGGIQQIRFS